MKNENSFQDLFTPAFDEVTKAVGLTASAIFGLVWRYCQLDKANPRCSLSLKSMSSLLNLSRPTLRKHLNTLIKHGWIVDTTPDNTGSIHVYRLTSVSPGKLKVTIQAEVDAPVPIDWPANTCKVSLQVETKKEIDETCKEISQPVKISPETCKDSLPKDTTTETKEETTKILIAETAKAPASDPPPPKPDVKKNSQTNPLVKSLLDAFTELVGYPLPNYGQEGKAAKQMLAAGYESQDILDCWKYMQADSFWRGKHISLTSVNKQIGAWLKSTGKGGNGNGITQDPHWTPSRDPATLKQLEAAHARSVARWGKELEQG